MLNKIDELGPNEIIPLKDDDMFTEIFNDNDNICALEEFIAGYFNFDLNNVRGNLEILPRKLSKKTLKESSKEVDLLLKYNNRNYNIEISTRWSNDIKERNVIFLSNIHGTQLNKGFGNYKEISESIQINLNAFRCEEEVRNIYFLSDKNGKMFSKKFRIDVIDMELGRKLCYTGSEEKDFIIKWCKVFMSKTKFELKKNLSKVVTKNTNKKLYNNISRLSGDKLMVEKYKNKTKWECEQESIMEERMELYKEKCIKEGIEQGIEQEKIIVAKKMLEANIDMIMISNITNLSIDELQKI